MIVSIEKIEVKEGGGIGVVLSIGRPLAPMKEELDERPEFKEELHRFLSIHLGIAELTQETKEATN